MMQEITAPFEKVVAIVTTPDREGDRERLDGLHDRIRQYIITTFDAASGFAINGKNCRVFEHALFDIMVAKYNFDKGNDVCEQWTNICYKSFLSLLKSVYLDLHIESDTPEKFNSNSCKILRMCDAAVYDCYLFTFDLFEELDSAAEK